MDGKRDLYVQKGPHHRVHNIHPMDQKGDTFPHKIQTYQDDQRNEKVLQLSNTFQFSAPPMTQFNPGKRALSKIRARWSNKARFNAMKTERPNTPDVPVTNNDTTDMDKQAIHSASLTPRIRLDR